MSDLKHRTRAELLEIESGTKKEINSMTMQLRTLNGANYRRMSQQIAGQKERLKWVRFYIS